MIVQEKPCSQCGKTFSATIENFTPSKRGLYGFHSFCRKCFSQYKKDKRKIPKYQITQREYYQRPNIRQKYADRRKDPDFQAQAFDYRHTDKYRQKQRERQALDPRRRERDRLRGKTEKRKSQNRDRYNNNPVYRLKSIQRATKRYKENKQTEPFKLMRRSVQHRRRARIKNAEGFHTAEDIRILIKTSKGICWWCGEKIKGTPHIDHRIPLAKGGSDWPNNLCLSCAKCNLSKNAKMPHEFNGRLL